MTLDQFLIMKVDEDAHDWLAALPNSRACEDCTARYQLLGMDRDGVIHFKIDHDPSCPWLAAAEEEAERS